MNKNTRMHVRKKMKKNRRRKSIKPWIKEWVEAIVIALIFSLVIRTFFIQAFKIPTGSMIPTLRPGDRIMVNKLFFGPRIPLLGLRLPMLRKPARSDVIVFVYPESANKRNFKAFKRYIDDERRGPVHSRVWAFLKETQSKDYIKRLIGLPGETVEIRDGDIYINGQLSDSSQIRKVLYFNEGAYGGEGQVVEISEDSYYCLGDNSSSSRDSRYWGFVNKEFLIGKAFLVYWPLNRIRIIR